MRNENNLSNRLSNEELEELVDILDTFPSENAMNLEMLDGFFTALGCCPRVILPSKFMHMIFRNKEGGAAPFDDIKEYERFFSLLMKHWCDPSLRNEAQLWFCGGSIPLSQASG